MYLCLTSVILTPDVSFVNVKTVHEGEVALRVGHLPALVTPLRSVS